jgi:ribonucleoside-diphosphate reductase alpha chain
MRDRLPNRRQADTLSFEIDGLTYTATFGTFRDGSPAEMFLNGPKPGTAADLVARESAILFSIARQYGAPTDIIFDALPKLANGKSAGPIGKALEEFDGN